MAMSQLYQQHLILSEIKPKISAEEIFILRTEGRRVSRVREREEERDVMEEFYLESPASVNNYFLL